MSTAEERPWLAVLMAWIAGCVDAVGYLALGHLFTSHMSGNTAAFGASAGEGVRAEALRRFFPVPIFVIGVFAGAMIVEIGKHRRLKSPLFPALILEFGLILLCLLVEPPNAATGASFLHGAALLAFAMGVQSSTVRRVEKIGVRTTFVTGMLTDFAEAAASLSLWFFQRIRRRGHRRWSRALSAVSGRAEFGTMRLKGGIWVGFVVGAILGGFAEVNWAWHALALPLAGLAFAGVAIECGRTPAEGHEKLAGAGG